MEVIEIKEEPTDWCGELTPRDGLHKFLADAVKTEAEGFDRLARSSYSAAMNLAHKATVSPKREAKEEEEEERGGEAGFGFVDVDATQTSEQCRPTDVDPLAFSIGSWHYKRAVLDGMKRAMLYGSSRTEPVKKTEPPDSDGDTTKTRVGDRGTDSTSSGCTFNSDCVKATRCGREDCIPEPDNSARTSSEFKTSQLYAERAKTLQDNAAQKEAGSNFSPQAKETLSSRTSDSRKYTHDACGKEMESCVAPTQHVSLPASGTKHERARRGVALDEESDPTGHVKARGTANVLACDNGVRGFAPDSERPAAELGCSEAKPHACDICDARFSKRSNLNDHKLTHTGQKRYTCDVCKGRFSKLSNLNKHRIIHTGVKPYACDVCKAEFYYKADFALHNRSHTGEKPYVCDLCNAKFAQGSALIKHKRSHTGEKPYSCDLCGAKFSQRTNRNAHVRRHNRDRKMFSCETCRENFSTQQDLMLHKIMQKRKNLCV